MGLVGSIRSDLLNALTTNPENSGLVESGRLNLASGFESFSISEAKIARDDDKQKNNRDLERFGDAYVW